MFNSFFILENDQKTIDNLKMVFEEFSEFTCVGISNDYDQGMNTILKYNPGIVFIDIDSFDKDNNWEIFSYCNRINEHIPQKPLFIALSSNKISAYQAIKNRFFDYILKPGRELEIRETILRLLKKQRNFLNDRLCLKSYKDFTLLNIDNILYLQADNNSTDFILIDGTKVTAFKTLKCFEMALSNNFLRIHNSYIINKNHIYRINFGKLKCFLNHNKTSLPFSKSYRNNLKFLENILSEKAISYN